MTCSLATLIQPRMWECISLIPEIVDIAGNDNQGRVKFVCKMTRLLLINCVTLFLQEDRPNQKNRMISLQDYPVSRYKICNQVPRAVSGLKQ